MTDIVRLRKVSLREILHPEAALAYSVGMLNTTGFKTIDALHELRLVIRYHFGSLEDQPR